MFNDENTNINFSECLGSEYLEFTNDTVKDLTPPEKASRALLQFYTSEAGIMTIGLDRLAYTPVAVLTESDEMPQQGYTGKVGVKLFNMAIYEVRGIKNIAQTSFMAFAPGYPCYCFIQYFK